MLKQTFNFSNLEKFSVKRIDLSELSSGLLDDIISHLDSRFLNLIFQVTAGDSMSNPALNTWI